MKKHKRSLFVSAVSLILCAVMLVGTTYAYFSDGASSNDNIIQSGGLDIDLLWTLDLQNGPWADTAAAQNEAIFNYDRWEPGYTEVRYFRIRNIGDLAFQYSLQIVPNDPASDLADVIDVYYIENPTANIGGRRDLMNMTPAGVLTDIINGTAPALGILLPEGADTENGKYHAGEIILAVALKMQESAGNEYQGVSIGTTFNVQLHATQYTYEDDVFGSDYDAQATLPGITLPDGITGGTASGEVTVEDNMVTDTVTLEGGNISAVVPEGVAVEEGTTELTLSVSDKESSEANITLGGNEQLRALDVHIEGVADSNSVPMTIALGEVLPPYMNIGNVALYHVENGVTNDMTRVDSLAELDTHNEYYYDLDTGSVTVALASFSEITLTATTDNVWNGEYDTSWYEAEKASYTIKNADQLAGFGQIVGGMDEESTQDSFAGATVTLISDIDLGDAENSNMDKIFYPIGYYLIGGKSGVNSFEGTFDGAGHTISNFYHNTWEMKGDYSGTYYNDAMGLFGYVVDGTIKNLTVDHFSSDGEFAPTGVITAYAKGDCTFENIAITNCEPATYNTGVAGIVGWDDGGDTEEEASNFTFRNITVDSSNTISALWGSWDVAAAGLLGYLGENSKANLENCNVSATIDVYNDVCGNYQYYWYRYCGMLIGTVDKTKDDGSLDLSNIEAENCTVNFGNRHEYYYCEFVENSKASYTHDYQFSRVDNTDIMGSGDSETCQNHNHEEHGYETVDGASVLVEDKQAVYIPFRQLFGGYGWGVKGTELGEVLSNGIKDITVEVGKEDSTADFVANDITELPCNQDIPLSYLFTESANAEISNATVMVGVTDLDNSDGIVTAVYTANTENWSKGTLKFSGQGSVRITIQDYEFSTPVSLVVTIREGAVIAEPSRFEVALPEASFLYRVGNANTVSLHSLFKAVDGQEANIGNVDVTVENSSGNAAGTYTPNTSIWTEGTIQFIGTGIVEVTIADDNFSAPLAITLEVVNATNVTAYSSLSNKNSVLLNDITMSSGSAYYLSNATLYGNGFMFDCTAGAYNGTGSVSNNYLICLTNASLDNVKIKGAVYTSYGAQVKDDYNRPLVLSVGNNTIANCYLSNTAAPVRVRDGNLEIINTTLKGGNFANLDIRNGHIILDNVTTINQVNGNDLADNGEVVVGLGVVVYYENVLNTTTIEVKNGIKQYNNLSKKQAETYITDDTAKQLTAVMYSNACSDVQYSDGSDIWVNTGILSMTEKVGDDNISDVDGYVDASPSMTGVTGYLHTKQPDNSSIGSNSGGYESEGQSTIAPEYSFDYTTKNYVAKTNDSNDYCYEDNGTVLLSMDEGDTFNWDTSILTVTKNGQTLDYTVAMDGTDYTGKSITFNTSGDYYITYTYTDESNYQMDENGVITNYSKIYTKTVHISVSVVEKDAKNAEFTFGSSNTASKTVTIGNDTYVMPDVSAISSTIGSTTVSGQTIYYPIVEMVMSDNKNSHTSGWYAYFPVFNGAVTITDYADGGTGEAVTYGSSTTSMPSGLSVVGDPATLFKYQSSSSADTTPQAKNSILIYSSPSITANRDEYNALIQYSYKDNAGTTHYYYIGYHAEEQTYSAGCVTPDTLVTLADGTQKRIDEVTYVDQLLVWDFYDGSYAAVPATLVVSHGEDYYTVIKLTFEDGTVVKAVNAHAFFNADLNEMTLINAENAKDYIGHSFVKADGDGYTTVKLVDCQSSEEYTDSYTLVSETHYNFLTENMFSLTNSMHGLLAGLEVGENMKYDAERMTADIDQYGMYTYADFADYITYEQFAAFNGPYLKISVEKEMVTFDEILCLIEEYLN